MHLDIGNLAILQTKSRQQSGSTAKTTPSCIETQTESERHDNISVVAALKSAHLTP